MEHCGSAVLEAFCVPDGLSHCLGYVQALRSLALNVNAWQAGNIRNRPITLRPSGVYIETVGLENVGKLDFTGAAFSLL